MGNAAREMPRLNSLTFRLIAIAAVWTVLGLAVGGIVLSDIFRKAVEESFDDRLTNDLEGLIAAAAMETPGSVTLQARFTDPRFERIYSGWYWQIEAENSNPQTKPETQSQQTPSQPQPSQTQTQAQTETRTESANPASTQAGAAEPTPIRPTQPSGPALPQTSRSLWDWTLVPQSLTTQGGMIWGYADGPDNQRLRVLERLIRLPGNEVNGRPRTFRFTAAGDLAEIQDDVERFDTTLFWSFGALGLGLIAAIIIQVRLGLMPLRRVRYALQRIREGRARRLEGDFPAEIAPLASELNSLIEYSAEVVARARGNVANLAHFLKTPLTVLANEVSGAEGVLADAVRRQVTVMRRQVDHYLSRARAAGALDVLGNRAEVAPVLRDLVRVLKQIHNDKQLDIAIDVPPALAFRGDREDLEEMAGNLIDNACKWANKRVKIDAIPSGGRFVLSVGDDGPGLEPEERERAVQRGEKLDESVPGSGLGLNIVRDIARLYGGVFTLDQSPLGGLEARLELPIARS